MDAKEASKLAVGYLADLFEDKPVQDIMLEEVERCDSRNTWLITLSFVRPNGSKSTLGEALGQPPHRVFKMIEIWNDTGKMESMKIRKT